MKDPFTKQLEEDSFDKTVFLSSLITNIPSDYEIIPYCIEETEKIRKIGNKISEISNGLNSPFPSFDQMILSAIDPGRINNIKNFPNVNTKKPVVIYDVTGYNFCENIGRGHTRNNVYFVANIFEECVYQKCYKCTDFIGTAILLKERTVSVFDDADNPDLLSACYEFEKSYHVRNNSDVME